jgi:hypothetical protein
VDYRRITTERELMAEIHRELRGGRLGQAMGSVVDVGRRRDDHHREGDREH